MERKLMHWNFPEGEENFAKGSISMFLRKGKGSIGGSAWLSSKGIFTSGGQKKIMKCGWTSWMPIKTLEEFEKSCLVTGCLLSEEKTVVLNVSITGAIIYLLTGPAKWRNPQSSRFILWEKSGTLTVVAWVSGFSRHPRNILDLGISKAESICSCSATALKSLCMEIMCTTPSQREDAGT